MAINGIYSGLTHSMTVKTKQDETDNSEKSLFQKEKKTLDDVKFSSLSDRLSSLVRMAPTTNVLDGMNAQMEQMKSIFLDTVQERLAEKGIKDAGEFSLKKNTDGDIVVSGESDYANEINALFQNDPRLVKTYNQIAEMSEMTEKVARNPSVMRARTGLAAYQMLASADDNLFGASFMMQFSGSSLNTFWM